MASILSQLRKSRGLSQEDVAEMMVVSTNTVSNWERTMRFRTPEDLHDLLNLYGVDYPQRCEIVQEVYGIPDCKAGIPCASYKQNSAGRG